MCEGMEEWQKKFEMKGKIKEVKDERKENSTIIIESKLETYQISSDKR